MATTFCCAFIRGRFGLIEMHDEKAIGMTLGYIEEENMGGGMKSCRGLLPIYLVTAMTSDIYMGA